MDAVEFLKEKARMCKYCGKSCTACPILRAMVDVDMCGEFVRKNPEKAVEIIEKWSKEHPRKTMMQDFFEKHPNAPKWNGKTPKCCPSACGYTVDCVCAVDDDDHEDCIACWSRPLEEGE